MRSSGSSSSHLVDLGNWPSHQMSPNKWSYRLGNSTIQFQKQPLIIIVFLCACLILLYFKFYSGNGLKSHDYISEHDFQHNLNNDKNKLFNRTYPMTRPVITPEGLKYRIAIIADPDKDSKDQTKDNLWKSHLKLGSFTWDDTKEKAIIEWDADTTDQEITSSMSNGGRGMELSELVLFNGHLYTADDRTGIVYKLKQNKKGKWQVIPWVILSDGNGEETKSFKCEWMTVKDQYLYVGGLGKEWTNNLGEVKNFNPMFVKRISPAGEIEHLDWYDHYIKLRSAAGITFPGYMIHEAVMWSETQNLWIFLPRRASKNKYNDVEDEHMGTNMLLTASETFDHVELKSRIGTLDQQTSSHGFSSFKFVPDTKESIVVALKSEEYQGKIDSYIMVFKYSDGTIIVPETYIGNSKYEGIEFI